MNSIASIANAFSAFFNLLTGTLPTSKEKQPLVYEKVMKRMALNVGRYLKHHPGVPTSAAVNLFGSDLPAGQVQELMQIVAGQMRKTGDNVFPADRNHK